MNKLSFSFSFWAFLPLVLSFQGARAADQTNQDGLEVVTESENSKQGTHTWGKKDVFAAGGGFIGGATITAIIAKIMAFQQRKAEQEARSVEWARLLDEQRVIWLANQRKEQEKHFAFVRSLFRAIKETEQNALMHIEESDRDISLYSMHNVLDATLQHQFTSLSQALKNLNLSLSENISGLVHMSCLSRWCHVSAYLPFFKKFSRFLHLDYDFYPVLIANQMIYYTENNNMLLGRSFLKDASGQNIDISTEQHSSELFYNHLFKMDTNNTHLNYMIYEVLLPYVLNDENHLFFDHVEKFGMSYALKKRLKAAVEKLNLKDRVGEIIPEDYLDEDGKAAFKEFINGLFQIFNNQELAKKFKLYTLVIQKKIISEVLFDLRQYAELNPLQTIAIDRLREFHTSLDDAIRINGIKNH